MAEPSATPNTPDTPKKGVLAFVQSLKQPKAAEAASTVRPSAGTTPLKAGGPLHQHFAEFSWSLQQNNWLKISFIVHCALVLLIWFGAYLAFTRPVYIQVGNQTLEEAAKAFYATDYTKVDPQLIFDQMSFFSISTLTLLHQIDAYSTPPLPLLKGMVRPEIIAKAEKRFNNNRTTIEKQKFVQNLVINRVLSPITNPEQGTVAIFVEGYFSIALEDEGGDAVNRVTPYRGKVILRQTPVSQLNPFPFTLDDLDEVVGADESKKWDDANKKFFK